MFDASEATERPESTDFFTVVFTQSIVCGRSENHENSSFVTQNAPPTVASNPDMWFGMSNTYIKVSRFIFMAANRSLLSEILGFQIGKNPKSSVLVLFDTVFNFIFRSEGV